MNLDRLRYDLRSHEGVRLHVYDDATGQPIRKGTTVQGHPTIGIGRNLASPGISHQEAAMLLEADMNRAIATARRFCFRFDEMNDVRQEALVNMAFNLGYRLDGFAQMRDALLNLDFDRAADEAVKSKWYRQVGARAVEVVRWLRTGDRP